ncbi:MAG: hypothetical protein HZA46_21895, partial [Planctomycetales bacterium]|nr:hypothetical protein [Planctomycetales bacterium]
EKAANKALTETEALKTGIGHLDEKVGEGPNEPNTVLKAITDDMARYAPDVAQKNYSSALQKVAEAFKNATDERNTLRASLDQEHKAYENLKEEYEKMLTEQKDARSRAEVGLVKSIKDKEEELNKKLQDIATLQKEVNDVQLKLEQDTLAWTEKEKKLQAIISNQESTIALKKRELELVTRQSFEVPDGQITWVDYGSKLVWIDIGSDDNLPRSQTFSVYKKSNSGIARGPEDVKGRIEVVRILGPHRAECRIMSDNIYFPMSASDPIHSTLWSAGRHEQFSVVGFIDADGDEESDRSWFHDVVATAKAIIDNEVDDHGALLVNGQPSATGEPNITNKTKFLIVGKDPDLASTDNQAKLAELHKITDLKTKMVKQAEQSGVEIISLQTFLQFSGAVKPKRVRKPGDLNNQEILKSGAQSKTTGETITKREAAGTTSGAFSGNKNLKPKTSSGQTSKLFK